MQPRKIPDKGFEARSATMTFGTRTQACLRDAERKAEDNAKHCETERDEEGFAFEFRLSEISENEYLNKNSKSQINNIVDPCLVKTFY